MNLIENYKDILKGMRSYSHLYQGFLKDIQHEYECLCSDKQLYILEQLLVADRIIQFKVIWERDDGTKVINKGWRVQHSNILGAYKGGLRFHPEVDSNTLRALAFEQMLKCALTSLPLGGAKGGSDFNPKDKSEAELKRFCRAFMDQLSSYIGENKDVPAGDMGVGSREIGYLYGRHIELTGQHSGVLTGKHPNFGGSCGREEATGYGIAYITRELLNDNKINIEKQRILISGAGNVALFLAQKLIKMKAKVITLSDTSGTLHIENGLTQNTLDKIKEMKLLKKLSLKDIAGELKDSHEFLPNQTPWEIEADIAIPCATQNEIDKETVKLLIKNQIKAIIEGANMPLTGDALEQVEVNDVFFIPAIAANAGGVAVSHFERSQNTVRLSWSLEEVEDKLRALMKNIYENIKNENQGSKNQKSFKRGAHVYAFHRLFGACLNHGI